MQFTFDKRIFMHATYNVSIFTNPITHKWESIHHNELNSRLREQYVIPLQSK